MIKEVKEDVEKVKKRMYGYKVIINKEVENVKRNQKEILELKNTITEMKNALQVFKGVFE